MELIKEIFRQLEEYGIEGIKYAAFKMDENVFIHLAQFESEEAEEVFQSLPAFRAFKREFNDRLISQPVIMPMIEIGTIERR